MSSPAAAESREPPPAAEVPRIASAAREVRNVQVADIRVNPLEPKARLAVDPQLVESIRDNGLLQPIIVGRKGGEAGSGPFTLLAGHRRFMAVQALGHQLIHATVLDCADDGGRVLLAENVARRDFSALEEADIVGVLIDRGEPYRAIASALGHSIGWVARRANLRNLSPLVRQAIAAGKEQVATWPPAWLEEVALLERRTQDEFLGLGKRDPSYDRRNGLLRRVGSLEELQEIVAEELRPLRRAKWDIADEQLVPSVGACTSCPKTTAATPTLFGLVEGDPKTVEESRCRDPKCWSGKLGEWLKRQHQVAVAEHGRGLLLVHSAQRWDDAGRSGDIDAEFAPWSTIPGGKGVGAVLSCGRIERAKKGQGQPAFVVSGPSTGKVISVTRVDRAAPKKAPPATDEDRSAAIAKKRRKLLLERLMHEVAGTELRDLRTPKAFAHNDAAGRIEMLAQIALRIALTPMRMQGVLHGFDRGAEVKLTAGGFVARREDMASLLWGGLRDDLVELVRSRIHRAPAESDQAAQDGDIDWIAELVGFQLAGERRAIELQLPAPGDTVGRPRVEPAAAKTPRRRSGSGRATEPEPGPADSDSDSDDSEA